MPKQLLSRNGYAMMDVPIIFHKRLLDEYESLKKIGLTQKQIGGILGCSVTVVSGIVNELRIQTKLPHRRWYRMRLRHKRFLLAMVTFKLTSQRLPNHKSLS